MADEINLTEIVETMMPLIEVLEQLGIEYHLGGSVASSLYGEWRRTQDVDIVAILKPSHVRRFVALLNQEYYLDEDTIRDAIQRHASFNAIHLDTGMKVDVFLPQPRAFDQDERQHIQRLPLETGGRSFPVSSPEAMVLRKLEWYEMGNRVSQRQWRDLLGILQKQSSSLDLTYLDRWARVLNVHDLLTQALQEAGLSK